MQIGLSIAPKEDLVRKFEDILPQIGESSNQKPQTKDQKFVNYHPQHQIIGDQTKGVITKSFLKALASYAFMFEIEPKMIDIALTDDDQIIAMEEELHQFTRKDVWTLVPKLENKNIIKTRWVYRNKLDDTR